MALPNYGSSKRGMPILDHRAAATPWPSAGGADAGETEIGSVAELTTADRARTVVANNRLAVLAVTVADNPAPLGFVVPYTISDGGTPFIGVRAGVEESGELVHAVPVSLTVAETPLTSSGANAFGGVTLTGRLKTITQGDLGDALQTYGQHQPADAACIRRGIGQLYLLELVSLLVTLGDGTVESVAISDFTSASSDPLSAIAPNLVAHLKDEAGSSLVLLCRAFGGQPNATAAALSGIDQYGIDLVATTGRVREPVRINFSHPLTSPEEVRRELAVMARGARFKLGVN